MKRVMIFGAALIALGAVARPADAADIPIKAPVSPIAAPIFNWTGWYGGLNAGYSWGSTDVGFSQTFGTFEIRSASASLSPDSFVGGGQFGYNYQSGIWVYGLEFDFAWRGADAGFQIVEPLFNDTLTARSEQKWFGTIRGRLGVTPTPQSLFYVTGGLAYGRFERSITEFCNGLCGVTRSFSSSTTRAGWTVGAGLERMLDQNWSFALEYLYTDFGTSRLTASSALVFGATTASLDDTSHVVRGKVNYRFASGR